MTLPAGLHSITFGNDFNQSMEQVSLPAGLQSVTFGDNFSQSMVNVTMPAGLQSPPCPHAPLSDRVAGAVIAASEAAERAAATAADAAAGLIDPASAAGAHALRAAARVKALGLVVASRFDADGIGQADGEAGSSPVWKRFVASLTLDERTLLRIYRGGAIRTPTRRHRCVEQRACPFCMSPNASARHYWQDCMRFNAMRAELEAEFGIQAWWGQQPACTSKSGWFTLGAHPKADKRVSFQIAACRLGLAVMQALPCDDHRYR